jgi:AraC family transcriptional regulator, regulatory protein of adaptative response / methylated-DNA-[protein]-cysteine methyltransferase
MMTDVTGPDNLDEDSCWRIALAKDRRYDGRFVTGVLSTGIYCRPSCPARAPLRANVRFFASPAEAEAAGLRPCLRCRPEAQARDAAAVARALGQIDAAEQPVPLARLAAETGYSPAHFQKLFKRAVGLSPAAYMRARRLERAVEALSGGASVT